VLALKRTQRPVEHEKTAIIPTSIPLFLGFWARTSDCWFKNFFFNFMFGAINFPLRTFYYFFKASVFQFSFSFIYLWFSLEICSIICELLGMNCLASECLETFLLSFCYWLCINSFIPNLLSFCTLGYGLSWDMLYGPEKVWTCGVEEYFITTHQI
jgi:hypothetical protein